MSDRYRTYPEYKDSGVEWLGQVPRQWEIPKLIHKTTNIGDGLHSTPKYQDGAGYYFVNGNNLVNSKIVVELTAKEVPREEYEQHYIHLDRNSVLISINGTIGNVALYNGELIILGKSAAYINCAYGLLPEYLILYLQSTQVRCYYGLEVTGTTIFNLSLNSIRRLKVCVSPENEQANIANFLDHETAKIDTLIEKQQQLIKLLKEKRQAVISHAVTKGLPSTTDAKAPMRDSGVEWLGEVPEHWSVVPLKHLCSLLKDGTHLPPPRVDSGVPLLSVRNIVDSKFIFRDDDSNISEVDYQDLCRSFVPQKGDVLLAIVGGTIGKVAIIEEMSNFHIQRSVAIFRVRNNILTSGGLANIMISSNFQSLLWKNVGFSAQPGIYLGALANFRLPIPPLEEQAKINKYCSFNSGRIGELVAKATGAVKLMKERRTALISAAVTGKIDVRNWQAPTKNKNKQEDAA